jgi:hypothetical protein
MVTRRTIIQGLAVSAVAAPTLSACGNAPDYQSLADTIRDPGAQPFAPDFLELVRFATLAANSHNTQPWLFSGDTNSVTIAPDMSRATPAADPDHHHVFASLGCAAENLSLAAGAAGRASEIVFQPDNGGIVQIAMAGESAGDTELFSAITERQCTRSDYDGKAIGAGDLAKLEDAARVDGMNLILITDRPAIENLLEIFVAANTAQIEDPAFRDELRSWIRFSEASAVATRDGLFSACSGNPTLPSWLGKIAFGLAFKAQAENEKLVRQIRSSAGLAVFSADSDDPDHWMRAGRSYQRFALAATVHGIRHAFVNQPLEVASFRPDFARAVGIEGKRPDLVVRFGYAPPMPRSLRRPVEDVIRAA